MIAKHRGRLAKHSRGRATATQNSPSGCFWPFFACRNRLQSASNGTDQITVKNWFDDATSSAAVYINRIIERVEFADGTAWTWADIAAAGLSQVGGTGSHTAGGLVGHRHHPRRAGNDSLNGGGGSNQRGLKLRQYWSSKCPRCSLKSQFTPSTERRVRRWGHEAILEEMQSRLNNAREMMRVRKRTFEHPFGTLNNG
jgi:hypothetical protein